MSEIVRFSDVTSMLLALQPDEPVLCVRAEVLRARARSFLDGLPGRVLYAMKCNPEPFVLRVLHEAGIRDFDTASLAEMAWIHDLLPAARCYFHHPVKPRRAIPAAYRDHGVRHFVVDHESELAKLLDCLDARDIAIHVRPDGTGQMRRRQGVIRHSFTRRGFQRWCNNPMTPFADKFYRAY